MPGRREPKVQRESIGQVPCAEDPARQPVKHLGLIFVTANVQLRDSHKSDLRPNKYPIVSVIYLTLFSVKRLSLLQVHSRVLPKIDQLIYLFRIRM